MLGNLLNKSKSNNNTNNYISSTTNDITSDDISLSQGYNDYGSIDYHLKPTSLNTRTAKGAFLGSTNNTINKNSISKDTKLSRLMTSPKILDHMSDELKFKLFGSKIIPFANSVDDKTLSTTRTTLLNENNFAFRILIAEETGRMACRNNYKVSLDHSFPRDSDIEQIRPNELKQYMFGSMIRATESLQANDKFKSIPNSQFILLTRIFYFKSIHNRFAISLCIPKILASVICECWQEIKSWLDQVQNIILSHLMSNDKSQLTNRQNNKTNVDMDKSLLPRDYKSQYPIQVDTVIHSLQKKLIPCLRSNAEIPRLFLYPDSYLQFVDTWFRDVFNWLEIKDGPKSNFLCILLATIITDVNSIVSSNSRVLILSGNMVVANKLLFIVSGVLQPRFKGKLAINNSNNPNSNNNLNDVNNGTSEKSKLETDSIIEEEKTINGSIVDNITNDFNDNMTITSSGTSSSKYHSSSKGWEIPKKATSLRSVSISSDDSASRVIQPSSFKSGSSSIRCLSTSLSSQPGSYGSWFNKRPSFASFMSQSPSTKISNDSWERLPLFTGIANPTTISAATTTTPTTTTTNNNNNNNNNSNNLHKTNSSTSLHQFLGRSSTINGISQTTPQQSPSISEYDEYPWFGTPESPRIDAYYTSSSNNNNNNNKKYTSPYLPIKEIDIKRDCQKIGQSDILDEAFEHICGNRVGNKLNETEWEITPSSSSHAAVLELNMKKPKCKDGFIETLPRYTSYLTHFNYWFQVQGIPITPDTDHQIVSAMKKDLQTSVYSTTLTVSLRSREIKKIIMKKDMGSQMGSTSSIKQKIKKIFNNGKYGHESVKLIDCVDFITLALGKAKILYADPDTDTQLRNAEILEIFSSIINYKPQ